MSHVYKIVSSRVRFRGKIFRVATEVVEMPGGGTAVRDITHHLGAVAVVALDDAGGVALIRQYRHAVRSYLWELPAGLCDVAGELGEQAAGRELAEEVDLVAADWRPLVDLHTSPGFSDELVRVYLARGLTAVPEDARHQRAHEEADLTLAWVQLDEAVAMVLRGEITNGIAVAGLLAAARISQHGPTLALPAPPAPSPPAPDPPAPAARRRAPRTAAGAPARPPDARRRS